MTPTSGAGAPGTGVMASSTTTSRASTDLHRERSPAQEHETGPTCRGALLDGEGEAGSDGISGQSGPPLLSELVGREWLAEIVVGALTLAPRAIALLVLR